MKYRELSPKEIEAYEIGYKVGNRKIIITDIEWESETEHNIYRKGYMAGLMDYKRNVSNVSNVSNVHSDKDKDKDKVIYNINNINNINNNNREKNTEKKEEKTANQNDKKKMFDNAIKQTIGATKGADAVVMMNGIKIQNPRLLQFIKARFDKFITDKVSTWAIDHNEPGKTYTAQSMIKLLTRFQADNEPDINYQHVLAEYLRFTPKNESETNRFER